jgi:hypothetical protein
MLLNSAYLVLIWVSWQWNSALDVELSLFCFLVISCTILRHYVISCLQWLDQLLFNIHNNLNSSYFCRHIWKLFSLRRTESDLFKNVDFTACKLPVIRVIFSCNFKFWDRFFMKLPLSNFTDIHPVAAESFPIADGQRSIMNYVTLLFCLRASNGRISIHSADWRLFSVYCSSTF